jgi:hypothetical protein
MSRVWYKVGHARNAALRLPLRLGGRPGWFCRVECLPKKGEKSD